jgi:hypothetical protein
MYSWGESLMEPDLLCSFHPSRKELAIWLGATFIPILIIWCECFAVLSEFDSIDVYPDEADIKFFQTPRLSASMARLSAVCPPMVASTASICLSSRILMMLSIQWGASKYDPQWPDRSWWWQGCYWSGWLRYPLHEGTGRLVIRNSQIHRLDLWWWSPSDD